LSHFQFFPQPAKSCTERFSGTCPTCGQSDNQTLSDALDAWEELFYPIDGMEIKVPDYTDKLKIVELIKKGRAARRGLANCQDHREHQESTN